MESNVKSIDLVKNQGKDTEGVEFRVDSVKVVTDAAEFMLHREEPISDHCYMLGVYLNLLSRP
jgi:hypothetical protein